MTEEEVQRGLLTNSNANKQSFFFNREYTNIDLAHSDAKRYIDVIGSIKDEEAARLLLELKTKVKAHLPSESINFAGIQYKFIF